jgi:GNAT superfamily N-acetyltransferase
MRRLFVTASARRRGVARTLADALLQEALQHTRRVTVHAGSAEAERFWEALGYERVEGRAWSHELIAG